MLDNVVFKVVSSSCDESLIVCYFEKDEISKAFRCFDNFVFENSYAQFYVKRNDKWELYDEVG